jgi:hypothetical protein
MHSAAGKGMEMHNHFYKFLILTLLLSGCATGKPGLLSETEALQAISSSSESLMLREGSFSLCLLGEQDLGAARAGLALSSQEQDGATVLRLSAKHALDLKGICFRLHYDDSAFSPRSAKAGSLFTDHAGELLELDNMAQPGSVDFGIVLANWDEQPGFSGTGELATVQFAREPVAALRSSSKAAAADAARARLNLITGSPNDFLQWQHSCPGDYDQNGEVNVADLTPLGQNFGESGAFQYHETLYQVDGDGNGIINISDITPIGVYYGVQATSYNVYRSSTPQDDYPAGNAEPSTLAALGTVLLADALKSPGVRTFVSFALPQHAQPGQSFWIRPADTTGLEGTASNRTDQPNGSPVGSPPISFLAVDTFSGDVPLSVNFDMSGSMDPDGDMLEYSVYLRNGSSSSLSTAKGPNPLQPLLITEAGNYTAVANVSDGYFGSGSAPISIVATKAGNHQPTGKIMIDEPRSGDVPHTVVLNMSASSDVDNDVLTYEFDIYSSSLAGPGLPFGDYEYSTGSNPIKAVTISETGYYDVYGRVTDSGGLSHTVYAGQFYVGQAGNVPPQCYGYPDFYSGTAPLVVQFDYNAFINLDPDGSIVSFEFDPEGSGNWVEFDWLSGPFLYTYEVAGSFHPRIRALDDGGLYGYSSSETKIEVTGQPGTLPLAVLQASKTSGLVFMTVDFDATGSSDPDGSIIKYEFDFDDGLGWQDYGGIGLASHGFSVGSYTVRLRVTDNEAQQDTAVAVIKVHPFIQL